MTLPRRASSLMLRAMQATKSAVRLADGRTLVYYDETPGVDRSAPDSRDLPITQTTSEIRHDVLVDQWVIIAGHRLGRTHLPPAAECPLCPSRPGQPTEIPAAHYDVVVFENRFPSLTDTDRDHTAPDSSSGTAVGASVAAERFQRRPGVGRCEVVCFTSDHTTSFSQLSPRRVTTVLEAWTDRTRELSLLPSVEQVFVFENRGEEIGVTLSHPHGQIYGYPFVPPRTARMLDTARRHRAEHGGCIFCAVVTAERKAAVRVVAETSRWTAFVPHAARWPFEVHLYPQRHVPDLTGLDDAERTEFAELYLDVLRRFDGIFGTTMPYIAGWQQAPVRVDRHLGHVFLQVFSIRRAPNKLKYLAGSESAMGVFINDIAPERAAEMLRDVR
jgi:UDPglucose--hexose-1-phosphate uridylyltransferase